MNYQLNALSGQNMRLVDLRAQLLCYGLRASPTVRDRFVNEFQIDRGFIHGTVFNCANQFYVNTALLDSFTKGAKAIPLKERDGIIGFDWDDKFISCVPLGQPKCLQKEMNGWRAHDYMRMHGPKTLFVTPVRQCIYGTIGKACKFCTFETGRPVLTPIENIVRMAGAVFSEIGYICDIAIGGGTPNLRDFGSIYYGDLARALQAEFKCSISVEIVPPLHEDLTDLLSSGIASLIMSLEVWDDSIRKELLPGKSAVSRNQYFDAWRTAVKWLGAGSVSSVLIVGLEPDDSTLSGIDALVGCGVIPTLIPFRPYDDCLLKEQMSTDHLSYIRCSNELANLIHKSGLAPSKQAGCTACGACSLDVPLETLLFKRD